MCSESIISGLGRSATTYRESMPRRGIQVARRAGEVAMMRHRKAQGFLASFRSRDGGRPRNAASSYR